MPKIIRPKKKLTHSAAKERIIKLRIILTIHSYIYYVLNDSLVTDDRWQQWAEELKGLQEQYPKKAKKTGTYDKEFKNWTGATGQHLSTDEWVAEKAHQLLQNPYCIEYQRQVFG